MIEFHPYASSSKGNLYTLSDGETTLMLECGLSWNETRRLLNFNTSSVAGILLTHSHGDHSKGAHDAIKAGVDIYASTETIETLKLSGHRVHVIIPREAFRIGTWAIKGFDTVHDAEGTLGLVLVNKINERFLFALDTPYLKYRFANLVGIAIECNYSLELIRESVTENRIAPELKNRVLKSHLSLETVINFLKANDLSDLRETYLLHLSDGNSDANEFKRIVQSITGKPCYVA